ncbi:uncharacterized protein CMU_024600 [Cryptosporidium muris RN66]|uniref:Uncharacterized protein n=1 Tax=Cryptosporidium muris (strain RN66) TaxID=441375 RepID=B6AAQ2_CRYMR|nr:uncharacterized protein CMU_024600 [Cryptosporidium muris RN66]EEA05454.1 hypothetical protein CMU_024600 [Cryptosporidium muris RN66]|eukprot:XP_002139803.1 hypothetical protein [Cryptosporidium muris RN66]
MKKIITIEDSISTEYADKYMSSKEIKNLCVILYTEILNLKKEFMSLKDKTKEIQKKYIGCSCTTKKNKEKGKGLCKKCERRYKNILGSHVRLSDIKSKYNKYLTQYKNYQEVFESSLEGDTSESDTSESNKIQDSKNIENDDKNSDHDNKSVLVTHEVLQDKNTGTCYILENNPLLNTYNNLSFQEKKFISNILNFNPLSPINLSECNEVFHQITHMVFSMEKIIYMPNTYPSFIQLIMVLRGILSILLFLCLNNKDKYVKSTNNMTISLLIFSKTIDSKIIHGNETPEEIENRLILGGLTRSKESCSKLLDTTREHFNGLEEITYNLLYEVITCVHSVQSHSNTHTHYQYSQYFRLFSFILYSRLFWL